MENRVYKAYVVREKEDGSFHGEVTDKNGVALMGVNSQGCPMEIRKEAWSRLSGDRKFFSIFTNVPKVHLNPRPATL